MPIDFHQQIIYNYFINKNPSPFREGLLSTCGEEPVPQRSEGMGFEPPHPLRVLTVELIDRREAERVGILSAAYKSPHAA